MEKYQVILADPPWSWKSYSPKGEGKSAKKHYKIMESDAIYNFPIADVTGDNCVLCLWTLSSMLPVALRTIDGWGFKYKTVGFNAKPQRPIAVSIR